jgi:GxxExxY protein
MNKEEINGITQAIIGGAIEVHKELGPGLLESAYQACLAFELNERGMRVDSQKELPVVFRGVKIDCGYRLDLLVEDCVIVEIKAVEELAPIHEAQLLSYLKLTGVTVGLLINFHVPRLTQGVKRIVHNFS